MLAVGAVLALTSASAAYAATITYTPGVGGRDATLTLRAAPGEVNVLTITSTCLDEMECDSSRLTFRGTPRPRPVGRACTIAGPLVNCDSAPEEPVVARVFLGDRSDVAKAQPGAVALYGGIGSDRLTGDDLNGSYGNDVLTGTAVADRILAGPGNDNINVAGGGRDTVYCMRDIDTVRADTTDRLIACERVTRIG